MYSSIALIIDSTVIHFVCACHFSQSQLACIERETVVSAIRMRAEFVSQHVTQAKRLLESYSFHYFYAGCAGSLLLRYANVKYCPYAVMLHVLGTNRST